MKRTPLKRRTPLKKCGKLNAFSPKRAAQHRAYTAARDAFMREHPNCQRCGGTAHDLHHRRGRQGKLLKDRRFFMAVCRECHDWIHANPAEARATGFLASSHDWNRSPEGIIYSDARKVFDGITENR